MMSKRLAVSGVLVLAASIVGCSSSGSGEEGLGVAQIAITNVPADGSVRCIEVTATGGFTTSQSLDVSPGQSTVFNLTGLPVGTVRFDGSAYPMPCAQVAPPAQATWVSDPVLATVNNAQPAMVMLLMHQNGSATVGVDFPGDTCRADGAPCFAGSECCSQLCAPDHTCQSANNCVPDGGNCMVATDCCSGSCTNGACGCPAGGTLCGGTCTLLFADPLNCGACGNVCPSNTACLMGVCVMGSGPSCADGIRNGQETDVDCGGSSCPKCIPGQQCVAGADCVTGTCTGNVCQPPGLNCMIPTDCPATGSECAIPTCVNGACGVAFLPAGTPLSMQTPGDCTQLSCDGQGGVVLQPDATDLPASPFQCYAPACVNGAASFFPLPPGTACNENGGTICDGNGVCQ